MYTKQLRKICKILDEVENINCGGCGISALAMYRALHKLDKTIKPRFAYLYYEYERADFEHNAKAYANNELDDLCVPSHVVFEFNGKLWDSTGRVNKYPIVQRNINLKALMATINNVDKWNTWFDRKEEIPLIESNLQIKLRGIKR